MEKDIILGVEIDEAREQLAECTAALEYFGMGLEHMTHNKREANALFPVIRQIDSVRDRLAKVGVALDEVSV